MRYDPRDPEWPDRDRFVLSNGHACILQYSMLHLTGYDLSLEDLRQFRQWGSRTPGHPEYRHTAGHRGDHRAARPGLRQRGGDGDRRTLAADHASATRCATTGPSSIAGDGCFMEGDLPRGGVAGRATSAWGGCSPSTTTTTSRSTARPSWPTTTTCRSASRPTAGGCATSARWPTTSTASRPPSARRSTQPADGPDAQPTLLVLRSHIGWPSPHLTDTAAAHGDPFGADEIRATKEILGPPAGRDVLGPRRGARLLRQAGRPGRRSERAAWAERFAAWNGDRAAWDAAQAGHGLPGWADGLPDLRGRHQAGHPAGHQPVHRRHGGRAARPAGRLGGPDGQQRGEGEGRRDPGTPVARRDPGPLRDPRARHGLGDERHGRARRCPAAGRAPSSSSPTTCARRSGWPR